MSKLRDSYTKLTNPTATNTSFEENVTGIGLKYVAETSVFSVSSGGNHSAVFTTKDKAVLILGFDIEFNQERIDFTLHEDVTSVSGVAPLSPPAYNVNRPLSDSTALETDIDVGPAIITGGTAIYGPSAGLGSAGSGNKGGAGSLTSSEDFIWLKPNTKYVFDIKNESASAVDLVLTIKIAEGEDFNV